MTKIHAEIPDSLARQLTELAQQEQTSVDQIVSIALASQISNWRNANTIAERAKRGSWKKFDEVMAKVRNTAPLPGDELK